MKLRNILTAALALSFASAASATNPVIIKFTGSTAYRGPAQQAIYNVFKASGNTLSGYGWSDSGVTAAGSAKMSIFAGTIGGVSTIVLSSFTGSEAGIQALSTSGTALSSFQVSYLNPANFACDGGSVALTTGAWPGSAANQLTAATGGTSQVLLVPDVTMSDTAQSDSEFAPPATTKVNSTKYTYNPLTEITGSLVTLSSTTTGPGVGVVPFKWVTNSNPGAGITNITSDQIRGLYESGSLPLAVFTGNTNQQGTWVYALGRNVDSGTRLTAFGCASLGATAGVFQSYPYDSTSTLINSNNKKAVDSLVETGSAGIDNITMLAGNNGYNSGGDLAAALAQTLDTNVQGAPCHAAAMIGYCGASDIDSYIGAGATELSYNGATLGVFGSYDNATPITQGQYPFWSYEHMYVSSVFSTTSVTTFAQSVANNIYTTTATLHDYAMQVSRAGDAGIITQLY